MEIWKDIEGYEGRYQVSNKGRVKSLEREVCNGLSTRIVKGRILSLNFRKDKYATVRISKNSNMKTYSVHRLVAESFIPNPKGKPEVNHKNGDKHDNRVENLEWATHKENAIHSWNNGFTPMPKTMIGENHAMSKVTRKEVLQIRSIYSQGWATYKELAEAYNMTATSIRLIVTGKNWSHI